MKYILNQNQCGFLMKHGCFVKTLYQGTYQYFKALGYEIVVEEMEGLVGFKKAPKEVLLADEAFAGRVLEARVPEGFLGILRENGVVKKVGTEPLTLYWNHWGRYTFELLDMRSPEMDEAMTRLESLPEPEPVPYPKDGPGWARFGILLSGIVSSLNGHSLDGMDVEEHIPVLEQRVVSIVRRSWGIDGRGGLLDMLRYLTQEGYTLRYQLFSEAASPEELMDETMDEDDRESTSRAWRFAQRYKSRYAPGFMAGWDVGRAAMLTRWGCYLGWLTESEAAGILWDLSQKVVEELHSWREFAQSYLFGGLMWKMLCGDSSAGSYLGYIADAATDLLAGKAEQDGGQWRGCPWPAQRKIGFTAL